MSARHLSLSLLAFFLLCADAQAQYIWLNENGTKQFSDRPPPSTVPSNRILKSPNKPAQEPPASAPASAPADEAANKPKKAESVASKNEDFNKRRAEQAEKEKKAADDQQHAADKSKNCERARAYLQSLESGVRIASTDKNGERSFISDEQRSKELADVKRALSGC